MFASQKSVPLGLIGPVGQATWEAGNAGVFSWICPPGVTSVCALCVAHGTSQGGGSLSWKNNIPVTPGTTYTVVLGNGSSSTYFISEATVSAFPYATRTSSVREGGGYGGPSGSNAFGGAGGYSGTGGTGGSSGSGTAGQGGGGGGGGYWDEPPSGSFGGYGGGVGLRGEGTSGAGGIYTLGPGGNFNGMQGQGGSGGDIGYPNGNFGGAPNGKSAVRLIWGPGRAFPSTNCHDVGGIGRSWSEKGISAGWGAGMCCSLDGKVIYAAQSNGFIYRSMDYGETWVSISGNIGSVAWNHIACSRDGKKLVALRNLNTQPYVSDDYGVNLAVVGGLGTWTKALWTRDNDRIFILTSSGLAFSSNGGASWNTSGTAPAGTKNGIAASGDGMIQYLAMNASTLYKSVDDGWTWTSLTASGNRNWVSVACSKDGMIVYGAASSGNLHRSLDGGVTWTDVSAGFMPALSGNAQVFCSNSGQEVLVVDPGSVAGAYVSNYFGFEWNKGYSNTAVYSGVVSQDGERMCIARNPGFIYNSNPRVGS
jgi:hypothetical protein